MTKQNAIRRRGTAILATAFSLAMVGTFAPAVMPGSPLVPAANAQDPAGGDQAIYSPGKASENGTISGSVKEIVKAANGFNNVQDAGRPMGGGVKVYAQWYEGVNTEHSSPVYYTESDANGNFTIKMGPYTDALGVTRTFAADASVGLTTGDPAGQRDQRREKIRMWTELPDDLTDKYRLVHQPAAGIFPGIGASTTPNTQGDGQWNDNKVSGVTIAYAQKDKLPQHLPENKWVESVGKSSNNGTYAGRAFWNLDVLQGALSHNAVSAFGGKDVAAAGLKVVGSYLNDEAVTKIEQYAKGNFAGKTLRGSDWTPTDEEGLQRWINEQVAADPEGWIAETVTTTTGADGRFQLFWKGIYGNNHTGTGGGINPPAAKLHKLAGSWEEGAWTNGNLQSKHVNMHWSYLSVLGADGKPLPDNIGVLYPWSLGQWAGPGFGADLNAGGNAQLFGGDGVLIGNTTDGYTGWNIALAPQSLKFDVVDKNTTDNWATVGDTVQTDTSGLPITEDLTYYIQWVDKTGKVVKTCETAKADAATKIPSCPLDVPEDAQTGDTFTARLKLTDGDPNPDDDLILALDAFAVAREYLEYDEVQAKAGEATSSEPKFDNPATDATETKPEKASFRLGTLPEGVTKDQVSVNSVTGVVTFTPNADQVGKTFKFPVMMRNENLQVPVLDENGDPVKGDDGQPKTQGRVVANADAPFTVEQPDQPAAKDNEKFEPAYEGKLVVPGDQGTTSAPSFTDAAGQGVDVPEDAKFAIGDGFAAPEGYVYNFDPSTGEITVSFPDKSKLNKDTTEAFDVPVKVTYKDGSTDEVKANFKLDTDGDRKPDTEDEDDDNDGIPDGKDSNPKVPNANDHYEPAYENGSGKPGDQVTVPAPTFKDKDGQGTTAPDGTMFTPGDGTPGGVTIDKNTGEIKVAIPGDAAPGSKIEVPVVVTYPDGTTDNVTVTVTVTEKDATPVTPGEPTEHNPSLGASADDPADCKMPPFVTVEKTEGVVYKVTVGGVELQPDAEGKYVYEYGQTVKVEASPAQGFTFPAGVKTTWTYTTMQNEICNVPDTKDNEKYQPKYEDGTGKPGDQVTVPAPTFTDKDGKGTTPPADTTFTPGNGTPDGVTIDKNTGQITVDIPGDATPGTKIEVPVVVTYPDGTTDNVTVTVTVGEPDTKTPDWKDGSGEPGGKVVIPNDGGPVEDGTTVDTDGPGKAKIDGDGNLVVDIDDNAKPGDKIVVIVKDKNGNEIDRVTVTVEKPAAGDMTTEPGVKKSKLARTGAQVAGLAGIAAVIGVAGLGLALVRRRREGEEN